jgi:hypothetical protein
MTYRRFISALLGLLFAGPSIFAQTPHPGLPSTAPWRIQQQENHAQRQRQKLDGPLAKAQADARTAKKDLAPIGKQPNRTPPRIYRVMRDARNIK